MLGRRRAVQSTPGAATEEATDQTTDAAHARSDRQHGAMPAHPDVLAAVPPAPRDAWRTWRAAWAAAAYGPGGFWTHETPGDHFATGATAGSLVARAVAGLVPPGTTTVVDVGAGDGRLAGGLLELRPDLDVVAVDRRSRPAGLGAGVRWVVDHWDGATGTWTAGGPDVWLARATRPLLVAHEWLDDLPAAVVGWHGGRWCEVEVDPCGEERPGSPVTGDDAAWLARWWDRGARAEVGWSRDVAWAALVAAAHRRGGRALAVDYGHLAAARPVAGSLAAYGAGRRRRPVPDGSVNLTASVAVDALAAAGEAGGATTLLQERQADVLARVPEPEPVDPLATLMARGERSALTAPHRWGDLWWLLQGAGQP